MMKSRTIVLTALAAVLALPVVAQAQTTQNNEVDPKVRAERQERRLEEIERRETNAEEEAIRLRRLGRDNAAERAEDRAGDLNALGDDVEDRREATREGIVEEREDRREQANEAEADRRERRVEQREERRNAAAEDQQERREERIKRREARREGVEVVNP